MGESKGNKMDILQDDITQETSLIHAAEHIQVSFIIQFA